MKAKKHVLILSSWYPTVDKPFLGNFVQRQAELLSIEKKVTVFQLIGSEKEEKSIVQKNDSFQEVTYFYKKHRNRFLNLWRERKILLQGLSELQKIDIIHAHVILPKALLFLWAKKALKVPLIITEHGSYFRKGYDFSFLEKLLIRMVISTTNQLVVVSEALKCDVMRITKKQLITVIPNHIDCELFVPDQHMQSEGIRFLHVSTLAEIKNVNEILEAFEQFYSKNISSTLTIISDEPSVKFLEQIERYQSKESIFFVGPLEWHETVSYYQAADCFILNSDYESFSIVIAESWSCGIPIISPSVGIASHLPSFLGIQSKGTKSIDVLNSMLIFKEKRHTFDPAQISAYSKNFDGYVVLKQLNKLYEKS